MNVQAIIQAVQAELEKHTWDYFVDDPPAIAQGGKGVVVPGCPACRKRLNTMGQFMEHISRDVIPSAIEAALSRQQPELVP